MGSQWNAEAHFRNSELLDAIIVLSSNRDRPCAVSAPVQELIEVTSSRALAGFDLQARTTCWLRE